MDLLSSLALAAFSTIMPLVPTDVKTLDWMAGDWVADAFGGKMEEYWTSADGGTMFGLNRVVSDGKTVHKEFLSIEVVDGKLVMRTRPGAFDGSRGPAPFVLIESSARRAVFEYAENDFPQRISYERKGDDRMTTVLIPKVGSARRAVTIEFRLRGAKG